MSGPDKNATFHFFDYKWGRAPGWASATEGLYRAWYLKRYGYKTPARLRSFLKDKASILEAGCGLARDSKFFAELNPRAKILAVDQSRNALRVAGKTLAPFPNCSTRRADLSTLRLPERFDFISCDQVVHHMPNPAATIKRLFAHLNPGGTLNFSVCRKKNPYRDLCDDLIMKRAPRIAPRKLWDFARVVTEFGRALHALKIRNVRFGGACYPDLQRYVHDNLFRCWYNPGVAFELCVSSNYDWFSNNPRFNAAEVRAMLKDLPHFRLARFCADDATISVSLRKL